jgi:ABC-type branched-subunit amino acid transport system ATPase component
LVGIVGPNGAGKSTLVKTIFGLVTVTEGSITFRGDDITSKQAHDLVSRGIGYVPQTENVFPSLTVQENMEMGLFLAPKKFKERFGTVLDLFPKLGERRNQRAGSLSGGERQMVAMGRALMMDPQVLLLDEPSAGLSPLAAETLFETIRGINAEGVAIVMVEQNALEALALANRGYILVDGRNHTEGQAADLATDPNVRRIFLGG